MVQRKEPVSKRKSCEAGFKLIEFDGDSEDNACRPYEGKCMNGKTPAQRDRKRDNHCESCYPGYYLLDNICRPYGGRCQNGKLKDQALRTKHDDCGSCTTHGFWLDSKDSTCRPWSKACGKGQVEDISPNNTRDRKCRMRESKDCGRGQWLEIITPNRRVCRDKTASCPKGFRLVESNDKNADNTCKPYAGVCNNGELKPQALRTKDNDCGSAKENSGSTEATCAKRGPCAMAKLQ